MTDYNIAYSELTDTYYITQNGKKVSDCTNKIQSIAEKEHSAMCESCIHKVSVDDIRNSAIDEIWREVVDIYDNDATPCVNDYMDYKVSLWDIDQILSRIKENKA